jgi:MFS family permease
MYEIGLLWLILALTGSTTLTGLVGMSAYLPTLLFALFAGYIVDQADKRKLMLWTDILRAGLALTIPILFFLDAISTMLLGIITFAIASLHALFVPARDALIPVLTAPRNLLKANSLMQSSWQIALILGPLAAGFFLQYAGNVQLFTFDALTFLLSFALIFMIPKTRRNLSSEARKQASFAAALSDIKAGLHYAYNNKILLILFFFTAIDNLFIMGPAIVGLPIFVNQVLQETPQTYALAQMSMAIGMISGTLAINIFGINWRPGKMLIIGIILDGLTYFPMLFVDTKAMLWLVLFVHGLTIPLIIIPRPTIIHRIVPPAMHGRIFALIHLAVTGLTAISIFLTGIIAEWIPIAELFAWIAILAALTGVVGSLSKSFRQLT